MRGRPDRALAFGIIALGVLLLLNIPEIGVGAGYDRIGPRLFPFVVAAGLIVAGGLLAVLRPQRQSILPVTWMPLAYLGLAFLLFLVLLEPAGFLIAASVQFWLAARAFQSRRLVRDATVAVLLSAIVYVAFTRGLSLSLPQGIFENLLERTV